jgi:hypothetical protein
MVDSKRKFEHHLTNAAAVQPSLGAVVTPDGVEGTEFSVLAAGGARIVSAVRDREIRKALMRDVRRRKLRLKVRLLSLYSLKIMLDLRYAVLLGRRHFGGYFHNLFSNTNHAEPPVLSRSRNSIAGNDSHLKVTPSLFHNRPHPVDNAAPKGGQVYRSLRRT